MKTGILFNWTLAGALLATEDADTQAQFFKAFIKEILTWPTCHQREMQLMFINEKMTDEEKELLSCLGYKGETTE